MTELEYATLAYLVEQIHAAIDRMQTQIHRLQQEIEQCKP